MLSLGYLTIVSIFGIVCQVCGQTAVLDGTNYVSGSGFCFGDQQLKKETTFISCTSSGFTGNVTSYVVFWAINGISDLTVEQVERMYPNQLDAMTAPQQNEFQLNILNVTSLGVSSVACRISAFNGAVPLGVTPLSTVESISVVNTVPAPEMPSVTPSDTSAVVTVSIPNGLCEGLRSGQITYEFKVYKNNSLVTTENVTTPFGPDATVTLYNLNSTTEYRLQIQGIIDVVSQSVSVFVTFKTLKVCEGIVCLNGGTCDNSTGQCMCGERFTGGLCETPLSFPIGAAVGGAVGGLILVIIIAVIIVIVVFFCIKSRSNSVKDNGRMPMSSMSREERANLTDDTYASPGTEKPQPENTDGVYSYAVTETKIGAQLKEREQQKQKPPSGDFYEEPNAAKNPKHKQGTITGEVYTEPEKPKRGTKKDKQQQPPVSHKEVPAGDLYAMPDKKKDVSHTTGPVTGEEYALASKPKAGDGYGAHGPQ